LICVARLVPIKNIANLLRAWKLVEKHRSDHKLVIIGDGPEFVYLNELTLKLKLKTAVFLGAVNNSELPTYFYNSVAFILPSFSESWGLVVNEAMAAGLPILLSNKINASTALLQIGANGFEFNPLKVTDIAETISRFIDLDLHEKECMSNKSLEIIEQMDYENMGNELYNALLKFSEMSVQEPDMVASAIINSWDGRYNTSGWNKL
jgi:glycosyltransferase involved in cell wall biosynthesis